MPNIIEQQICDAIDLLINKRVSSLQFDKTIRATIVSAEDQSIGKYRVRYQDSFFSAYADPTESYRDNTQVYVQIPSNDFNKIKRILGPVKKLGVEYLNVVTGQDRMSSIGGNIFDFSSFGEIGVCSYKKRDYKTLYKKGASDNTISLDDIDYLRFNEYKKDAEYLKVAATIRTDLPFEQQELSKGNYGLIIQTNEFSSGQTEANKETYGTDNDTSIIVQRTYVLDAQNMTGFIYGFNLPTHQYFYSEKIKCKDIIDIESITIFCENFPKNNENETKEDIFFSDIQLSFAKGLTMEQLAGVCLTIETNQSVQGGVIESDNDDTLKLVAKLQIQGRPVNFSDRSDIQLYWFKKDTSVRFNDPYYLEYGGQGWHCLNKSNFSHQQSDINETIRFVPGFYEYYLLPSEAPAKINTFKCVAVFSDGTRTEGTVQIIRLDGSEITITSTAGTKFKNDKGKTTLTCNIQNYDSSGVYKYCWAYRYDNGVLQQVLEQGESQDFKNVKSLDISIESSIDVCIYECTVFKQKYDANIQEWIWDYIGTADITLTNGIAEGQYSLIINNSSQVFKYNEYGVSPASRTIAKDNRKQPFSLTFDIYDDQGLVTTPRSDDEDANKEKVKQCNIKWIWPNTSNTLLKLSNASGQEYQIKEENFVNPANNERIARNVVYYAGTNNCNIPQLPILIENNFNFSKTDNTIRLQVEYEGQHLSASTNFSFIKEGQSGTNGTEYVVRIVPTDENAERIFYERITNGDREFYQYNKTTSLKREYQKLEDEEDDIYGYKDIYKEIFSFSKHSTLKAQLFDGFAQGDGLIYDTDIDYSDPNINIEWSILNLGSHGTGSNQKQNISLATNISKKNVVLNTKSEFEPSYATIVQAKISSNRLSEKAKNYFATYPIDIISTNNAQYHAIVEDGYRECMFQNDGTRSSYKTIPFKFRLFKGDDLPSAELADDFDGSKVTWEVSWQEGKTWTGQEVNIDPPEYFNSAEIKNYIDNFIKATYKNNGVEVQVLLSIYLYLNRYGLAAMNDWDGTSIKLNTEGDQYILAPQMGAGTKNENNQFTGITMGKSFTSNKKGAQEIGLMAFDKGIRSIFLDAEDGKAVFGKADSDSGQIIISPEKYGIAPKGSLYSSNFYKEYTSQGKPSKEWSIPLDASQEDRKNKGMLIDLATPQIRFGNGNFSVNSEGHLTARGDGHIAGWRIDDENLYSDNKKIYLNSTEPKIYGQSKANKNHSSLDSNNAGFYLGPDGLSISSEVIETDDMGENHTYHGRIQLNTASENPKIFTGRHANLTDTTKGFYLSGDGLSIGNTIRITANEGGQVEVGRLTGKHWTISGLDSNSGDRSYIGYGTNVFNSDPAEGSIRGSNRQVYIGTDGIRLGSKFAVDNDGNLTANYLIAKVGGNLAGWTIQPTMLYSNNIEIHSDGWLRSTDDHWKINKDGSAQFTDVQITSPSETSTLNWGAGFGVTGDGKMWATSGTIGTWNLSPEGFGSGSLLFTPNSINLANAFQFTASGGGYSGKIGNVKFSNGVFNVQDGFYFGGNKISWQEISIVTDIDRLRISYEEKGIPAYAISKANYEIAGQTYSLPDSLYSTGNLTTVKSLAGAALFYSRINSVKILSTGTPSPNFQVPSIEIEPL